jgi:uncharacterized protein
MIHIKIREDMMLAMRSKDALKLSVLRGLLSSFTNEAVAKGKKPDTELEDKDAFPVIKRAAKQRKDSIEQFTKGGRLDLAEKEEQELKMIEEYLPEDMSREEVKKVAKMKMEEMNVTDKSGIGKLTGAVMKEIAGRADGNTVKEVLEELLN